jgi:hypothetical protein
MGHSRLLSARDGPEYVVSLLSGLRAYLVIFSRKGE